MGRYRGFFALIAWAGPTIFNLTLWLHPLGRYALNQDEKTASACCLGAFLFAGVCLGFALSGVSSGFYWAASVPFLCLPIAATFNLSRERKGKRRLGFGICAGFTLVALLGVGTDLSNASAEPGLLWLAFVFGMVAFSWLGNVLLGE